MGSCHDLGLVLPRRGALGQAMTSKPPDQPDFAASSASGLIATLSDDVRRFLLTSVSSIPYLEALLLRSQPKTR